ncbi:MAG: hypothetical protein ACE5LB_09480 [Acidiferrobacterales bacterium]
MKRPPKAMRTTHTSPLRNPSDRLDGLNTYIDGKMKRYYLLFAVNGGAFAIAKLLGSSETHGAVGGLSLQALAVGCVLFTALMWRDIYAFGELMRVQFFDGQVVFQEGGKLILASLCVLLMLAWLLAAFWSH